MQENIKRRNVMKNTVYGIILAALAASLSLASCTKEMAADPGNGGTPAADGVREFTLSFAAPAKSAPGTGDDWRHPVFSAGDVIKLSNGTTSEDCTVAVSGSVAKIRTTLAGTLKAVYPASAAVLSSGTTGYITGITVPAAQDGTFAAANICMAENIAVGATSITLENKTALFKVTPPSGVKAFTVTSLKAVVGGVARTGAAVPINSSEVVLENKVITVSNTALTTFYVSLLPGAKLSDLSFEYTVTGGTYDGAMKGIPEKDIQTQATALGKTKDTFNNLAANNAYDIGSSGWHPYVTIGGKKWATMNIGATDTDPYGTYFAWGETNGIKPSASSFSFPTSKYYTADNNSWTQSSGFAWENCPWTKGIYNDATKNVFTKYTRSNTYAKSGTADNKKTLDLADDAAYANWGGPWRMPTDDWTGFDTDVVALVNAAGYLTNSIKYSSITTEPSSRGVYYYNGSGTKGVYFVNISLKKLFFPAAGFGSGTSLNFNYCYYWSSSILNDSFNASSMFLYGTGATTMRSYERYKGFPVRPVADWDREISEESANPAEMEEENVF